MTWDERRDHRRREQLVAAVRILAPLESWNRFWLIRLWLQDGFISLTDSARLKLAFRGEVRA